MTSPVSASDRQSKAFDLLAEPVRRWIWRKGWTALRDIQERSIPHLINGDDDLIVAAATAGGKTEAAFLPLISRAHTTQPKAKASIWSMSALSGRSSMTSSGGLRTCARPWKCRFIPGTVTSRRA